MTNDESKYFNEAEPLLCFDLFEDNQMSLLEKLKLKIVKTHMDLYNRFPTLHSVRSSYYSSSMGLAQKGWNPRINQVAWDVVQNIKKEEEYKKEGLIMYAYLNNRIKKMQDESLIPMKDGSSIVKIKYDALSAIVKNELNYINEMEVELKQQLVSQQEDKKQSPSIHLAFRDWYGCKSDFKKEIDNFFGQELVTKINYLKMNESLPYKTNITSLKRNKI